MGVSETATANEEAVVFGSTDVVARDVEAALEKAGQARRGDGLAVERRGKRPTTAREGARS